MTSDAIFLVTLKITVVWDFMPCGLEGQHFSRTCCLRQGRKLYFPNQIKCCSLQDRSLAHEMAEIEVNMHDSLLYIILLQRNMRMTTCILKEGFFFHLDT
jgi:hypothetical protein